MTESPIKRTSEEWDAFFYSVAERVASLSKDPDRKVGAVLVTPDQRQLSMGYNGFPSEVQDLPSLLGDKAFKLTHMVHAELNCLRQTPFDARGCSLYVTRFPCLSCARHVIDVGVTRVVCPRPDFDHHRWGHSWTVSSAMFELAGVTTVHPSSIGDFHL